MKFFVGKFSVSDNKSACTISGYVEVENNYVDSLLFFSINPYGDDEPISMKMNSIEMRALAIALKMKAEGLINDYSKESGGSGAKSTLSVYSNDKYDYIGLIKGSHKAQISFKQFELLGLSQEMQKMCDEVISSLYKTQQFVEKKKNATKAKVKGALDESK